MNTNNRTNLWAGCVLAPLCAFALAVGGSHGLSAQQPSAPEEAGPIRGGFHFSVGLGSASVGASCPSCQSDFFSDRINGFAGNLQIGGAVNSRLIIAAEAMGWFRNDDPIYRRIAALGLVVLGYPSERSGFFIKGGGGGLRAIAENDFVRAQTDAWTAQTGIGYDIPVGGRAQLTPQVTYIRTFGAGTWFNGVLSPETVTPNAIQLGVALTM